MILFVVWWFIVKRTKSVESRYSSDEHVDLSQSCKEQWRMSDITSPGFVVAVLFEKMKVFYMNHRAIVKKHLRLCLQYSTSLIATTRMGITKVNVHSFVVQAT